MTIDYLNSGHLKMCLLSEGLTLSANTRAQVGKRYAENMYPYDSSNKNNGDLSQMPTELVLPEEVDVAVHIRSHSPWSIEIGTADDLVLKHNESTICNVKFSPRPGFFDKKLHDGTLCQQVCVMYGLNSMSFFVRGWCYNFTANKPCKFCSLKPTRNSIGKSYLPVLSKERAGEAAKIAFANATSIKHVNYCSGAHKDNDIGIKEQVEIVKAVKKEAPKDVIHHILTIPPDNLNLLTNLKEAGINTIAFNLEVFDPKLFEKVCPGKAKFYGYENYFKALKQARQVFGDKKVYCGFVLGLEPVESLIQGMNTVAEMGYIPALNIFHADPGSEYENKQHPSIEDIWAVVSNHAKLYRKYDYTPIFPGGSRSSLEWESYKGYFG